jgi:hypothetical protein
MASNDEPEKHRGRSRTLHPDKNCASVKGLVREDQRVRVRETHCKTQLCITLCPFERVDIVKECLNL